MAQDWNNPALPWQDRNMPWKSLSMASNDAAQTWHADPRASIVVFKRDGSSSLQLRDASSVLQLGH